MCPLDKGTERRIMTIQTVDIKCKTSADYACLDIYTLDESKEMPSSRIRPMVISLIRYVCILLVIFSHKVRD